MSVTTDSLFLPFWSLCLLFLHLTALPRTSSMALTKRCDGGPHPWGQCFTSVTWPLLGVIGLLSRAENPSSNCWMLSMCQLGHIFLLYFLNMKSILGFLSQFWNARLYHLIHAIMFSFACFLTHYWFRFATLFRIYVFKLMRHVSLWFSSFVISLSGFGISAYRKSCSLLSFLKE